MTFIKQVLLWHKSGNDYKHTHTHTHNYKSISLVTGNGKILNKMPANRI